MGTITSVRKVAKVNPKITVQHNGPQNTTVSPPTKKFGFHSETRVKKLIFKPVAKGINPKIVVIAVSKTGLNLAAPPLITEFLKSSI